MTCYSEWLCLRVKILQMKVPHPYPIVHTQIHHHQHQNHLLFSSGDCAERALLGKQTREEAEFSEPGILVFSSPSPQSIFSLSL